MGLSTHVLDTVHGKPAAGMKVALYRRPDVKEGEAELVRQITLNADGRTDGPLYADGQLEAGCYRLVFGVADYFRSTGVELPEPPFLDEVTIDFGIAHADQHYHVPLLVSPWTYSTYRGS